MDYPRELDTVQFIHHRIPKKNGKIRNVFEVSPTNGYETLQRYYFYARRLRETLSYATPNDIKTRCAYTKDVSIPHLISHLGGSKVLVQLDITDFFNNVRLEKLDHMIPNNYYYNPLEKIGIKQGTNISGDITNAALIEFDKLMIEMCDGKYARYADDIIIGVDTMEEANEKLAFTVEHLQENYGLEINKRKTQITDLTEANDRYVKYLGYTIKRDKLDPNKLRVTISRKNRKKWWARTQYGHAKKIINEEEFTCLK